MPGWWKSSVSSSAISKVKKCAAAASSCGTVEPTPRRASSMRKSEKCLLAAWLVMTPVRGAVASESDAFEFFKEEAKVVTAARRPQAVQDSPLAVELITAEEIRGSG